MWNQEKAKRTWSGLRPALRSLPVRAAFLTQEREPSSHILSGRRYQSHMPMSPGAANHGHLRLAVYIRSGRGLWIPGLSPCAWRTVGTEPPIPASSLHPLTMPQFPEWEGDMKAQVLTLPLFHLPSI